MKTCPACGESPVRRRVKVDNKLSCPYCHTPVEIVDGELVVEGLVPPIKKLEKILLKNIKARLGIVLFPYVIPNHMKIRTKKILKLAWFEYFSVALEQGLSVDQMLECFDKALTDLLKKMNNAQADELGLLLWYISGKEHYLFKYILGKHVQSVVKLSKLSAKPDSWLD